MTISAAAEPLFHHSSKAYLGLIHYPVLNKNAQIITSAVTNINLHDLSRAAATYGLRGFYVVHPIPDQQELAGRIMSHWTSGYGAAYNPTRKEAFLKTHVLPDLAQVLSDIREAEKAQPRIMVTGANHRPGQISFDQARQVMTSGSPILILFGTSWGLAPEVFEEADFILEPIWGPSPYNHLSVRSAAAIILDRLFGRT
ncbi:MAG: RNA methyltransferase [Deltaproteobacteria bacterium]|nr:RNA methyltransferase [Deltaproteobacteria bacterium]